MAWTPGETLDSVMARATTTAAMKSSRIAVATLGSTPVRIVPPTGYARGPVKISRTAGTPAKTSLRIVRYSEQFKCTAKSLGKRS